MKTWTKKSTINWDKDSVIIGKWGRLKKGWQFSKDFAETYPNFVREFEAFADGQKSKFADTMEVLDYVEYKKLPIKFYSDWEDKEFKSLNAVREWARSNRLCAVVNEIDDVNENVNYEFITG